MLQQTQVARVAERFEQFMQAFPTVHDLARADEQAVLAAWQGLGYYRRARNLHAAARKIVNDFGGRVPSEVELLRQLPGVGRYTAGAIASIVFGEPAPIVDGNVQRVLVRWSAKSDPVDELTTWFWNRAEVLAASAPKPGAFNEALMELGATICTPRSPECKSCPVRDWCEANRREVQNEIPRPKAAVVPITVHHHAILIRRGGKLLFMQREADAMWAGMWQVPTVESTTRLRQTSIAAELPVKINGVLKRVGRFAHQTTHRRIEFHVFAATSSARRGVWRRADDLDDLPMGNAQKRVVREFGNLGLKQSVQNRKRGAVTPRSA